MFSLFNKTKKEDERGIEQVIDDIAENHRKGDYEHLYMLLEKEEIFIPVHTALMPDGTKSGEKCDSELSGQLKIKSVLGPNDQPLLPAATKTTCAMLHNGYLSIKWIDFLDLVQKTDDTDGTFLEGENSWVRFNKDSIPDILESYMV